MALITKFITYPNEMKAMGIGSQGVSPETAVVVPSSEEDMKQCIREIHDFIVTDLGMTHVEEEGELDLDNIVDLGLATHAQQHNTLNPLQELYYGYKMYAFNDELQAEKPLFIKFNYGVRNVLADKYNAVQFKNRFAFVIKYEIIYENIVIYSSSPVNTFNNSNGISAAANAFFYFSEIQSNSEGFYAANRLYLDLFPSRKFYYSIRNHFNVNSLFPHIRFYIERNQNYIKVINFSFLRNNGTNSANTPFYQQGINITYIPYRKDLHYSSNNAYIIPFFDRIISNKLNMTFRTLDMDPMTNIAYENYNIMTCYRSQNNNNSNTLVDVDVNGETSKYYYIRGGEGLSFIWNENVSTLLKVD